MRESVALFDQSSLALFRVEGGESLAVLQRLRTAHMEVPAGKVVYTQWLNPNGGIEADLTVTKLADDASLGLGYARLPAGLVDPSDFMMSGD